MLRRAMYRVNWHCCLCQLLSALWSLVRAPLVLRGFLQYRRGCLLSSPLVHLLVCVFDVVRAACDSRSAAYSVTISLNVMSPCAVW